MRVTGAVGLATMGREARRIWRVSLFVVCGSAAARAQETVHAPLSSFGRAKAEALLDTRLPCLGCHVIHGRGGRIGPDLTGVASRRSAAYIAAMIENPQRVLPRTIMPRTPMPDAVRQSITAYLAGTTTPYLAPTPMAPSVDGAPATGAALYAGHCAMCHGEHGDGDGPNARYLPVPPARHSDSAAMSAMSDHRLFDAIAVGGYPMGRSPMMPAFGLTLSRDAILLLVRHIRLLCRCEGPAWGRIAEPAPGKRR